MLENLREVNGKIWSMEIGRNPTTWQDRNYSSPPALNYCIYSSRYSVLYAVYNCSSYCMTVSILSAGAPQATIRRPAQAARRRPVGEFVGVD